MSGCNEEKDGFCEEGGAGGWDAHFEGVAFHCKTSSYSVATYSSKLSYIHCGSLILKAYLSFGGLTLN